MTDLVAFLRARLDEVEAAAREAAVVLGEDWSFRSWGRSGELAVLTGSKDTNMSYQAEGDFWETEGALGMPTAGARHIARHDPARVLREVEAKRRIVDEQVKVWPYEPKDYLSNPENVDAEIAADHAEKVLRLLALPYADHPDYREEWKP